MATNITTAVTTGSDRPTITLSASGNNRGVVASAFQSRNPPNITGLTLDGVSPAAEQIIDDGIIRVIIGYWLDADLPASAGTYDVLVSGSTYSLNVGVVSADEVGQGAPDYQSVSTSESYTFSGDGRLKYFSARYANTTHTPITGTTTVISDGDDFSGYAVSGTTVGADGDGDNPTEISAAYAFQLGADSTPDQFTFTDQTDVPLNSTVDSNVITVAGITVSASYTVAGPVGTEHRINGGTWTDSPSGTVDDGDTVQLRLPTASGFSSTTNATLDIGGVTDAFSATTEAEDTTPDAFSFTDDTGVALDTLIVSNSITVTGINSAAAISIASSVEANYRVNAGAWTDSAGTVSNGDGVEVQVRSSNSSNTSTSATLTIGGVSDTYSVTTADEPPDTTPDQFTFTDQTDVAISSTVTSNAITVLGVNTDTPIGISGESGSEYRINAGSWRTADSTVSLNDEVEVRLPTSSSFSTTTDAVLDIGGVTDTFSATTVAEDTTPQSFTFTDQGDVARNTAITSNAITVTGINSAAAIAISGDASAEYRINAGAWVSSSGTVNDSDEVEVRVTSSSDYSDGVSATLTIGGVADTFTVTTEAEPVDTVPEAFAFADHVDAALSTVITSDHINVTGVNASTPISISGDAGAEYQIDGGTWDSDSGFLNNGAEVRVRVTSSDSYAADTSATLDIGGVTDTFTVTTITEPSGAIPITATDGDTDVSIGQDPGLIGSITSILLRTTSEEHSVELPFGASHAENLPRFDMPDFLSTAYETEWVPWDTASYALRIELITDDPGDDPYVAVLNRELPVGYAVQELNIGSTTNENSIFFGVAPPATVPPAGSQVLYPTASNTSIDSLGVYTTDLDGEFLNMWIWRADTGEVEFEQFYIPGKLDVQINGSPATLEPGTTYTAAITNSTGIFVSGKTYSNGEYPVTIESADHDSVTFTTSASLPTASPVDFSFTYQTRG